jgi:hypothetical protein
MGTRRSSRVSAVRWNGGSSTRTCPAISSARARASKRTSSAPKATGTGGGVPVVTGGGSSARASPASSVAPVTTTAKATSVFSALRAAAA